MGKLDGRVAIITGAAQGIGAAYARRFAEEGARLVLADVVECDGTVDVVRRVGGEVLAVTTDVADETMTRALAGAAIDRFGKIDILINNAALFTALKRQSFLEIDVADWDRVIGINVKGAFLCCKAVVPHMKAQKYGKIINVGSPVAMLGVPWLLHYVTSKGAIAAMTRALARELGADEIRVNTLAPGFTLTEGLERQREILQANIDRNRLARSLRRDQRPEDLVGAAVFLASEDGDFVTGQTLVVDGGHCLT